MIYYIDNDEVSSQEVIKKFLGELKTSLIEDNVSDQLNEIRKFVI